MTDHPDFPNGSSAAPGTGPKLVPMIPKNDIAAAREKLGRDLDELIQAQETIARLRRASFLALVAAGFTEAQALELCCK